jgi:hypothetical protein
MKRVFLGLIIGCFLISNAYAGDYTLTAPRELFPPQAHAYRADLEVRGDASAKRVTYSYYWIDGNGYIIRPSGKQQLVLEDWDALPDQSNSACVAVDDPFDCCDGEKSGTCDDRMLNSNCVSRGDPLNCCTSAGEGICEGWQDAKTYLIPFNNWLKTQLEKWEGVETQ